MPNCPKCGLQVKGQSQLTNHGKTCGREEEFFWAKVEKTPTCWLWKGHTLNWGHGEHMWGGFHNGRVRILAHRYSWHLANGPIPAGKQILHKCNVRHCVNPDHLYLGSYKENGQDMVRAGTSTRGERNSKARLTAQQVRDIRSKYWCRGRKSNMRVLQAEYGVSQGCIYAIVTGKNWGYLS